MRWGFLRNGGCAGRGRLGGVLEQIDGAWGGGASGTGVVAGSWLWMGMHSMIRGSSGLRREDLRICDVHVMGFGADGVTGPDDGS